MRGVQILNYIQHALVAAIPLVLFVIMGRIIYLTNMKKNIVWKYEFKLASIILYVICLYRVTVFRQGFDFRHIVTLRAGLKMVNWIPFVELNKLLGYRYFWSWTYNVVGNIVWFLPLGYLLPMINKRIRLEKMVFISFLVSFSIELLQFIFVIG
ncbi:MAG: VanZ family protein, partial [Cellulosilyticaceae bacterium]